MVDRSDDASCLLGLEGLAVERVVRTAVGGKIVQLVTDDPDAARCPACATVSTSGKDWVLTRPRDLPCGGGFAVVLWRKRRWRCRNVDCDRQTFHRAGRPGAGRDAHHHSAAGSARGRGGGRPGPVRGRCCASGVVADGATGGRRARRGRVGRAGADDGAGDGRDPVRPAAVAARRAPRRSRRGWPVAKAHGSVGDRVRRHHRLAGPVGAGRRPDQRRGPGLAGRPHARSSGPGSRWW